MMDKEIVIKIQSGVIVHLYSRFHSTECGREHNEMNW